jgi:hypothetical protein
MVLVELPLENWGRQMFRVRRLEESKKMVLEAVVLPLKLVVG